MFESRLSGKRRRIAAVLAVVAMLTVWLTNAAPAGASSTATFTFANNTGQGVSHLIVVFNTTVTASSASQFNGWGSVPGEPTAIDFYMLYGTQLADGLTATVVINSTGSRIAIKQWWWTDQFMAQSPSGHNGLHRGCKAPDCVRS